MNKTVYRYVCKEEFQSILNGEFLLTKISDWRGIDEYENYLSLGRSQHKGDLINWKKFSESTFAICFTENARHCWKRFDDKKTGKVRLEMEVNYLKNICYEISKEYIQIVRGQSGSSSEPYKLTYPELSPEYIRENPFALLMLVQYLDKKELRKRKVHFHNVVKAGKGVLLPKDYLVEMLFKQDSFKQERECRLVAEWNEEVKKQGKRHFISFKINPTKLIRSVLLPPYMGEEDAAKICTLVREKLGREIEIRQTKLRARKVMRFNA